MKKIIHHLRKQSEEDRRHILHILIFIIAVIMIALWIFSLRQNLTGPDVRAKIEQDLKPFSELKDNLVDGYQSVSNTSGTE